MTQAQQPDALQLAQFFESMKKSSHRWHDGAPVHEKAAAELRRLHAEVEQLRALLASEQQDAARYRWVREQAEFFPLVMDGTGLLCAEHAEAEAEIDAAIAAAPEEHAP